MLAELVRDTVTLGERIRKARLHAGLSTWDLARVVGLTDKAVGAWERGGGVPSKHFPVIAVACGVTEEYIATGKLPMVRPEATDEEAVTLFGLIQELSPEDREVLRDMANRLKSK